MNWSWDKYLERITPAVECPFSLRTTAMAQHSHGVFWTGVIVDKDGAEVGTVEQMIDLEVVPMARTGRMGNGGADLVLIKSERRQEWEEWLSSAYPHDATGYVEENAVSWMTSQEDGPL